MSRFSKATSNIAAAVKKMPDQIVQNTVNAGVAPIEYMALKPAQMLAPKAVGMFQTATGILQANPELAGLAGAGLGMAGLGGLSGLFGGMGGATAPVSMDTGIGTQNQPQQSSNTLLYVGLGVAVLAVAYVLLRK